MDFKHTNLPIEKSLPKLVRDKIPQIIESNEKRKANVSTATDDKKYLEYLLKKLIEEADEVRHHADKEDLIKELADLKELTLAIMKLCDIKEDDIEKIRMIKKEKNGAFEKRYILESF